MYVCMYVLFQIFYQCTETSIRYFWLRMARMEMDCNLKKLANYFLGVSRTILQLYDSLSKGTLSTIWCILTKRQQNLRDKAPLSLK